MSTLSIRMRQIAVVPHLGATDQMYGLGEDGVVYEFKQQVWCPLPMSRCETCAPVAGPTPRAYPQ